MTDKLNPAVLAEPADVIAEERKDAVLVAAENYRARKDADPAVLSAARAAQLNSAVADLKYYEKLVAERRAQIKQLTSELNDAKDADIAAIAASVADVAP